MVDRLVGYLRVATDRHIRALGQSRSALASVMAMDVAVLVAPRQPGRLHVALGGPASRPPDGRATALATARTEHRSGGGEVLHAAPSTPVDAPVLLPDKSRVVVP